MHSNFQKTIKETILNYNLDKQIYNDVILSKKKLFPHITMNVWLITSENKN